MFAPTGMRLCRLLKKKRKKEKKPRRWAEPLSPPQRRWPVSESSIPTPVSAPARPRLCVSLGGRRAELPTSCLGQHWPFAATARRSCQQGPWKSVTPCGFHFPLPLGASVIPLQLWKTDSGLFRWWCTRLVVRSFKILRRTEMDLRPAGSSSASKTLSMSLFKLGVVSVSRRVADLYWIHNLGWALSDVFYVYWVFLFSQQPHEVANWSCSSFSVIKSERIVYLTCPRSRG